MYGTIEGFRDFILASGEYADPQEVTDNTIENVLDSASAGVDSYVGRPLSQATVTEYYSGNGRMLLPLRRWPVTSITSLYVDSTGYFGYPSGAFGSTTQLTAGTHYVLARDGSEGTSADSGMVVYLGGASNSWLASPRSGGVLTPGMGRNGWPMGVGNIKITYTGGYAITPQEVITATYLLAQTLISQSQNNQFQPTSESIGPYSVNKSQLQYYAREVRGFATCLARYRETAF